MHFQIFDAHRAAIGYIGNVAMLDIMAIQNHYQTTTNRFHFMAFGNEHARIFAQAYTYTSRISSNGLCKPAKTAPFFKMRINNHIINKTQSGCNFYFAFQVSL